MKTLSIDIETYCDAPLQKTGVYRYCESPNFEILLFAYSVDNAPVEVVDLACGEKIPEEVLVALEDENVIKWAFNASFERICLSRFLGYPTGEYLDPESWRCSMICHRLHQNTPGCCSPARYGSGQDGHLPDCHRRPAVRQL